MLACLIHLARVNVNVALKHLGVTFQTLGVINFRPPVHADSVELVEFYVAFFCVTLDIFDRCCCDHVEVFQVLELQPVDVLHGVCNLLMTQGLLDCKDVARLM